MRTYEDVDAEIKYLIRDMNYASLTRREQKEQCLLIGLSMACGWTLQSGIEWDDRMKINQSVLRVHLFQKYKLKRLCS